MSNEVKIGILAIAAIALSFWGYKFILGKNMLVKSNIYKVIYDTTEGMQVGTQVRINGVEVGSVASISLLPDDKDRKVLVILDLDRSVQVPKNTVAVINSVGFMGGKAVNLEYDTPCNGDDCAQTGDYLKGETQGLLTSMLGEDNAKAYVKILMDGLQGIIDTLNRQVFSQESNSILAQTLLDLRRSMANLEAATAKADGLLARSSGKIDGTLTNLDALTGTLNSKKEAIGSLIDNFNTVSGQLAEADIKKTLGEVEAAVKDLKKTLNTADQTFAGISTTVGKLNEGEGTLGKLLHDDQLYYNLRRMSNSADSLFTDFQDKPYRYMPLKSRKKVQKYDKQDGKQ